MLTSLSLSLFSLYDSFKFLRIFPLSQFDLLSSRPTLTFPDPHQLSNQAKQQSASKTTQDKREPTSKFMSPEMEANNPAVDYTLPELITFIFSDVGSLRPSGVGDALLAVYGGNAE